MNGDVDVVARECRIQLLRERVCGHLADGVVRRLVAGLDDGVGAGGLVHFGYPFAVLVVYFVFFNPITIFYNTTLTRARA